MGTDWRTGHTKEEQGQEQYITMAATGKPLVSSMDQVEVLLELTFDSTGKTEW